MEHREVLQVSWGALILSLASLPVSLLLNIPTAQYFFSGAGILIGIFSGTWAQKERYTDAGWVSAGAILVGGLWYLVLLYFVFAA